MLWQLRNAINAGRMLIRGYRNHRDLYERFSSNGRHDPTQTSDNSLRKYFDAHVKGRGIWKWQHYLDVYDKHFRRFVGEQVHILEIGVYSGGSLDMWKCYFGAGCRVYGVDIEDTCREYEGEDVKIFIGDQQDRKFWRDVKSEVPQLDIVIDDGGHKPQQQIVSIEELLPHLRPGGIYVCEDVHGGLNDFASYVSGLAHNLNTTQRTKSDKNDSERRLVTKATNFQSTVNSIHLYPYLVVVEKTHAPIIEFVAPKHGTVWKPHLT